MLVPQVVPVKRPRLLGSVDGQFGITCEALPGSRIPRSRRDIEAKQQVHVGLRGELGVAGSDKRSTICNDDPSDRRQRHIDRGCVVDPLGRSVLGYEDFSAVVEFKDDKSVGRDRRSASPNIRTALIVRSPVATVYKLIDGPRRRPGLNDPRRDVPSLIVG